MEKLERLIYRVVVLFCILAVAAGLVVALLYALMCVMFDRSLPKNYPDDWGAYVWVSEEPKAFISGHDGGGLGGQIEIDGEIKTVDVMTDHGSGNIIMEIDSYSLNRQRIFYGYTKYKPDCIICKIIRKNEYFGGQKIVFTKYPKDEVSPVDFGFEIENWDDIVTKVDSFDEDKREERPERTPCPAPTSEPYSIPTPVPISTPVPTPELAYLSANVLPTRSARQPRRIAD